MQSNAGVVHHPMVRVASHGFRCTPTGTTGVENFHIAFPVYSVCRMPFSPRDAHRRLSHVFSSLLGPNSCVRQAGVGVGKAGTSNAQEGEGGVLAAAAGIGGEGGAGLSGAGEGEGGGGGGGEGRAANGSRYDMAVWDGCLIGTSTTVVVLVLAGGGGSLVRVACCVQKCYPSKWKESSCRGCLLPVLKAEVLTCFLSEEVLRP